MSKPTAPPLRELRLVQDSLAGQGKPVTFLGIGPMSPTVLQAACELAQEEQTPLFFIASRNQVDAAEFGRGYVQNWDQNDFAAAVERAARAAKYTGPYYLCRDHGGPWQRDEERRGQLGPEEAMARAKRSFLADLLAGFNLLHVDPTKDPHYNGAIPPDVVLGRTIELIGFIEGERKKRGLPPIDYEIGTEETSGSLTAGEDLRHFAEQLSAMLDERNLPRPEFIVGQTGTLTRLCRNVGNFDGPTARRLAKTAAGCGLGLKEHNADYLSEADLLAHPSLGIHAANVAPEFGAAETVSCLDLGAVEERACADGMLPACSGWPAILTEAVLASGRWAKWLTSGQQGMGEAELRSNPELLREVVCSSGHYVFHLPEVDEARRNMLANLRHLGIDGERQAVNTVKASIRRYIDAFNLRGFNALLPGAD